MRIFKLYHNTDFILLDIYTEPITIIVNNQKEFNPKLHLKTELIWWRTKEKNAK